MNLKRIGVGLLCALTLSTVSAAWVGGAEPLRDLWRKLSGAPPAPIELICRNLGGYRPLLARLDGQQHAPRRAERGVPVLGESGLGSWAAISNAIERQRRAGLEAVVAVSWAAVEVAWGNPQAALDEAIQVLEAAEGDDASRLADLAALYFTRAEELRRPHDFLPALERAKAALELEPRLAAAQFNGSLTLEYLALDEAARESWERYLELDGTSLWSAEARDRLRALEERRSPLRSQSRQELEVLLEGNDRGALLAAVEASRGDAYYYLERVLLPRLHERLTRGEGEAELELGGRLASVLEEVARDGFFRRTLESVRRDRQVDSVRHRQFVAGFAAFREAREAYGHQDLASARSGFEQARELLQAAGSPWELKALFFAALCASDRQRYEEAQDLFETVAGRAAEAGFPDLEGDAFWMVGVGRLARGDPDAALTAYQAALEAYEVAGDPAKRGGALNLIAETHDFLGAHESAWQVRIEALRLADRDGDARPKYQTYLTAAASALAAGFPTAALRYQDLAVRWADELEEPSPAADALLWRGRMRLRAGDAEGAAADVEAARTYLARIPDQDSAGRTRAALRVIEAETRLADDPAVVVRSLSGAVEFYRSGFRYPLASALLARARAHLALEDDESAARDLAECVSVYESIRAEIGNWRHRILFFDQAMEAFDELTRLRLGQGEDRSAFETSEQRRGRALMDSMARARQPWAAPAPPEAAAAALAPMALDDLQAHLPEDVTLLEYAFDGERWSAFVVRRETFAWQPLAADSRDLGDRVGRFGAALAGGKEAAARRFGEDLYRRLVAPVEGLLGRRLVVVPDGVLQGLPFGALIHPATGRYLIQDRVVSAAPSASLYAALRHATLPPAELDVLAVGDPAFDRDLFVQGRLPEAEEEARRIAALYRRPELLTGADATEERFLELAPRAAVVHFGGHAEVDPRQPGRSRLLLAASETPDGGALHAHELQELRLSGTRLVVLGACSTAVGQRSRAEGVMSLAYAFMAAGAPAVVASLWDVNDGDAATLLVRFHERLAAGRAAPDALREAQLEVIAAGGDARSPSAWAAFQLFGDASLSND